MLWQLHKVYRRTEKRTNVGMREQSKKHRWLDLQSLTQGDSTVKEKFRKQIQKIKKSVHQ